MSSDVSELKARAMQRMLLLTQVIEDLAGIVQGSRPTPAELAEAPLLSRYRFTPRSVPCVLGHSLGHPTLRDGPIITSQIIMIGPQKHWVRTLSRFYRLEAPDPTGWIDPSGGHQQ